MTPRFAVALNCIDGRPQVPVINWMKRRYDIDYLDLVTSPGVDKVLADGCGAEAERLKANVELSIAVHGIRAVAVVGHHGCAANPVSESEHFRDITASVQTVASWNLPVSVIGLWVDALGHVHVVSTLPEKCRL